MPKWVFNARKKIGLPPGTLVQTGGQPVRPTKISVLDYNEQHFEFREPQEVEAFFDLKERDTVSWINIDGIADVPLLKKIDEHFVIHPLVLEDILNTSQRPKLDDYEGYLYLVLRMIYLDAQGAVSSEQVSFIIGPNYVLSFQEQEGDVFELIRQRIREGKGRIRKMGADYLAYALLDAVVDSYFIILEKLAERIEELEEDVLKGEDPELPRDINHIKQTMIYLRKQIWPLREVISVLLRGESKLIQKKTRVFLRDVYDHTIQVMDTIESFRDMISGLHDMYMTAISNRMNEVMKVLTIFASIFIPLTFLAGIYGMNFEYMPELRWRWSYFVLLGVMACVVGFMLRFFRKKGWL